MRRWLWAWSPAATWAAFLFVMSSIPGSSFDLPGNSDKLLHAAVYAVLGALVWRAIRLRREAAPASATILAVVIAAAYGVTDELHQTFTPRRSADWRDVVADAMGALFGALVCTAIVTRPRARRARRER